MLLKETGCKKRKSRWTSESQGEDEAAEANKEENNVSGWKEATQQNKIYGGILPE